jgi:hypothetical protein
MRRVFRAYIWRNPVVGYIQGMNYPMFRIRKVLSEEDTFWTLCLLVETYLPPDFFVEMYGATTHATILEKVIEQYNILPGLLQKFTQLDFPVVNLTARLYLSLFCQPLPEDASLRMLDLLFLQGMHSNKVIFDITLGYLMLLNNEVSQCKD